MSGKVTNKSEIACEVLNFISFLALVFIRHPRNNTTKIIVSHFSIVEVYTIRI